MSIENTFDHFLKDQLGFLKGNYDRFEFTDLKPAVDHASKLGFFELEESQASLGLLCSLLKKSARFDGGFAMTVFIQAVVQSIFKSAEVVQKGWVAFQPFQGFDSKLQASRESGNYFLQGQAPLLALGKEALHALVVARAEHGLTYFVVELSNCKNVERVQTIGMRTLPLYDFTFEKAPAILIGEEAAASVHFSEMAKTMRLAGSAMMLGLLEGAYQDAFSYSHDRIQGGRKIVEWSEHKMVLSQILAKLKACEILLAHGISQGENLTESQSISTLIHFQDSLAEMTSASMQAMGGAGYMKDYPLERFYRDGHQLRCLFGTSPFHKLDLFSLESHGKA